MSFKHAISCTKAPKNIAHGTTNDTPLTIPNLFAEATKVTIASPSNPNAEGSATSILM